MTLAGYLLQALAAVLAVLLTRQRRYHRPFAVLATALAIADPARALLHLLLPYTARPAGRWLMIVDASLWAIEPLGLAVCACAVWAPRAWPHVAGIGVAVVVALCLRWSWGAPQAALANVTGGALCLIWALYVREVIGGRWRGKPTTLCVVVLASVSTVLLLGPWLTPDVWAAWSAGYTATVAGALVLCAAQLAWMRDTSDA